MTKGATRADVCALALADCFRGDGEIMASPMGNLPQLGARFAKRTFEPELVLTDGVSRIVANVVPIGPGDHELVIEGSMPFRAVFDALWGGKRHVMMGASQIDRFGNQNISCIGAFERPKVQLLGSRGAPGNTICHATSYWVPRHSSKSLVERVDVVSGVGYDRAAALGEVAARFHEIRRVVTNLAVLDFEAPGHSMRIRSLHPGVRLEEVEAATAFELRVPDELPETRTPDSDELAVLRELDPHGLASAEVPS